MPKYPSQIDTSASLPTAVDNLTPVQGAVFNRLRDAVIAVEQELGVKPSGSYSTVRARLDALETLLGNLQIIKLDGDLGGTLDIPKVIGIQGRPVSDSTPDFLNVLAWNGIAWIPLPVTDTGGGATPVGPAGGDLDGTYPSPTVVDLTIASEEQGSVLYFNGTNWVQLPPGSDGYFLQTHSTGQNPTWAEVEDPPPPFSAGIFGSGSDGDLTASSGTTTLTRDTYYRQITLTGSAIIDTAGYKIYASEFCDISGLTSGKIWCAPGNGGNASGMTPGAAGATPPAGSTLAATVGDVPGTGSAGGAGQTGSGATSSGNVTNVTDGWGGNAATAGNGSQGGMGYSGNGGGSGTTGTVNNKYRVRERVVEDIFAFIPGANAAIPRLIRGGAGGVGGGGGYGGDGIPGWASGGGGGGGGGGGCLWFAFAELITGASTNAGALAATGGNGGNGSNAVGDATAWLIGGGNGGAGGGGGIVYGYVGKRTGPTVTGLIDISGGYGGNGGNGHGTGNPPMPGTRGAGGSGGGGGESGQCFVIDIATGNYALSRWANAATLPTATASTNPATLPGTTGTSPTLTRLDF